MGNSRTVQQSVRKSGEPTDAQLHAIELEGAISSRVYPCLDPTGFGLVARRIRNGQAVFAEVIA